MSNVQSKIAVAVVSIAVVLLVIGVIRALSPKEHYYEWAEPARWDYEPAGPAGWAAPAGDQTAEQLMSYMDTDRDGKITMDEAPEELKASFAFIDTNADGGIDVKEAQVMADHNNSGQP